MSNVEALGSAIMVHFGVEAPKVETEDIKALEKDAHSSELCLPASLRSRDFALGGRCVGGTGPPGKPHGSGASDTATGEIRLWLRLGLEGGIDGV